MTEAEWLADDLLHPVMHYLNPNYQDHVKSQLSDRKMRLFACGCCRRLWDLLDQELRSWVVLAEGHADGRASDGMLSETRNAAYQRHNEEVAFCSPMLTMDPYATILESRHICVKESNMALLRDGLEPIDARERFAKSRLSEAVGMTLCQPWPERRPRHSIGWDPWAASEAWGAAANGRAGPAPSHDEGVAVYWDTVAKEATIQKQMLRDVIPNPFRPTPTFDPAWLRWHDATIPRLAQQMYDARDFVSMPILADALEEAGCTSGDILDHCRGSGPHVRGCWVVDLVLGKE